jgi:regulatory protein
MNKTMLAALRLLARREYSKNELSNRLLQQFSAQEVEQTIETCCQQRLLSDERFIDSRIRHRISQGYGPEWIKQDLRAHQLNDLNLSDYLSQDDEFWIEQAIGLLSKKFSAGGAEKLKMQRYLYQRGYSMAVIQQSLKRFLQVND